MKILTEEKIKITNNKVLNLKRRPLVFGISYGTGPFEEYLITNNI